jgi:nitrate/nitrite transporter NarK
LALEAVFPDAVRKIYVHGWQPVMWIYGAAGLFVAGWFYLQVRDEPRRHPHVNDCELDLIEAGREEPTAASAMTAAQAVPMRAILRNRSLWYLNVAQFGTNIGWAFLVTLLDRYLFEVHRVPYVDRGLMQMVPLFVGWGGMLAGGWLTDRLSRGLGVRAGRALPVGLSRFVAMGAFLMLLFEPSPWTCTILFAVVAFGTDMGSPAVWAYYQDVGGRSIAAVLGWGNMWGNFGAMVSPLLIGWIARQWSWNAAFTTCAAAFLLAGVCGLAIDATRPVVDPAPARNDAEAGQG